MGLNLLKIGEEARVRLDEFNLDGKSKKVLRNTVNKLRRDGLRLEIVPADAVASLLPRLKPVSDCVAARQERAREAFLAGRVRSALPGPHADGGGVAGRATGGVRQPVAERNHGRSFGGSDAFIGRTVRSGIMDYLFVELMLWARGEGYRWFNLGMAPLAGPAEPAPGAAVEPLRRDWCSVVGERFYNFRGLQRYKEKFDPQWEPRYMAVPGGIALPMILANVASLISGGLGGVVRR